MQDAPMAMPQALAVADEEVQVAAAELAEELLAGVQPNSAEIEIVRGAALRLGVRAFLASFDALLAAAGKASTVSRAHLINLVTALASAGLRTSFPEAARSTDTIRASRIRVTGFLIGCYTSGHSQALEVIVPKDEAQAKS